MYKFYAEIDVNSVCFNVKQVSGEIINASHIEIQTLDGSLLGKTWSGVAWLTTPAPPAPLYAKYTYLEFLEQLMLDPTSAATLLSVKKSETPTGAMIEIMMEMIKTMDGVDFNSEVSRARLNSLVPAIFSPEVAINIMMV